RWARGVLRANPPAAPAAIPPRFRPSCLGGSSSSTHSRATPCSTPSMDPAPRRQSRGRSAVSGSGATWSGSTVRMQPSGPGPRASVERAFPIPIRAWGKGGTAGAAEAVPLISAGRRSVSVSREGAEDAPPPLEVLLEDSALPAQKLALQLEPTHRRVHLQQPLALLVAHSKHRPHQV